MGTKEVMVSAPLVVLLYDRTFLAGSFGAAWRLRRGLHLALAATWLLLLALVVAGGGSRGVAAGLGQGLSVWHYLLTQCSALVRYASLTVWPHPLVLDYGTTVVRSLAEVWWQGTLILAALAATAWALHRRPVAGFVGATVFLLLAPSSSFVPLVTQTIAEHRMYLPLALLVTPTVAAVFGWLPRPAAVLCTCLALGAAGLTAARNHDYRSPVALWSTSVAAWPSSPRAHNNLAQALVEGGRPSEAEAHFTRAVALDPGYVSARYNWGVALIAQKRWPDAVGQLQSAVKLAPQHADAHLNLGLALLQLDRSADAVVHLEHALRLHPAADAHFNLAVALAAGPRHGEADAHLQSALRLDPSLFEAHYQRGRLAEQAGQTAAALAHFEATLRLAPAHLGALRRLGLIHARREDYPAALRHFSALVRLQPTDADAQANLGNVLLLQGRVAEAIVHYETALRLRPEDPRTRENLQIARQAAR
jgi:tetratricopeptide (TPR) repeat protein